MKTKILLSLFVTIGFLESVHAQASCANAGWKITDFRISNANGATDTQVNSATEGELIATYTTLGLHAPHNLSARKTETRARINMDSSGTFTGATFPNDGFPNGNNPNDFVVSGETYATIPAGQWSIGWGCDGGSLKFRQLSPPGNITFGSRTGTNGTQAPNELRHEAPRNFAWTTGVFTLAQETVVHITFVYFERDGGDNLEIAYRTGSFSGVNTADWKLIEDGILNWKLCDFYNPPNRPATLGALYEEKLEAPADLASSKK